MNQTAIKTNQITINGRKISVNGVSPTITLLQYLKQKDYVGTKEGCSDGDCGACTIVVISKDKTGAPQYQAMNSCIIPLGSVIGKEIVTVEGIMIDGKLHPVQEAMVKTGGSQCGYCTPGFIMSLFASYYEGKVDDISVEGNLCRCTGYIPIRKAAQMLTNSQPQDYFSEKLQTATLEHQQLSYQNASHIFYYPKDLATVLNLLQEHPEAVLVAGGTDLGLELSHHRQNFPILISLEEVAELHSFTNTETSVEIGAAIPLSHLKEYLAGMFPSIDEMIHWFAACQVRNRATLGGNIGTASPIGDLPPVLLSLDAKLKIAGKDGTRILPLVDFFHGYRQTDLKPGEVIVAIEIPKTLSEGAVTRLSQSYKIGKRGTDDISIVAAAFTIDLDANNHIVKARLGYGGVAAIPIRATEIESILVGKPWTLETVTAVKPLLRETFTPLTDLRASANYRKMLVANLFERFFLDYSPTEA